MEQRPFTRDRSVWAHGFGAATILLTLTLIMALAGMTYETIARRYARMNLRPPGALIDLVSFAGMYVGSIAIISIGFVLIARAWKSLPRPAR